MIVTKIILVVDGKEIPVDIKSAEQLYKDLDKIFGKKTWVAPAPERKKYPWEDKLFPPYVWYSTGRAGE